MARLNDLRQVRYVDIAVAAEKILRRDSNLYSISGS